MCKQPSVALNGLMPREGYLGGGDLGPRRDDGGVMRSLRLGHHLLPCVRLLLVCRHKVLRQPQ